MASQQRKSAQLKVYGLNNVYEHTLKSSGLSVEKSPKQNPGENQSQLSDVIANFDIKGNARNVDRLLKTFTHSLANDTQLGYDS